MEEGQGLLQVESLDHSRTSCRWVVPSVVSTVCAFGAVLCFGFHWIPAESPLRGLVQFDEGQPVAVNQSGLESLAHLDHLVDKKEELLKLLPYLRSHPKLKQLRSADASGSISEDELRKEVRERILELEPAFHQVSPITAAKLGIAITTDDLALLGAEESPNDIIDSDMEIRTLKDGRRLSSTASGPPWKSGRIRFCFHSSVPRSIKVKFMDAVNEWIKAVPCLSFQQFDDTDDERCDAPSSAILVTSYPGYSSSGLGANSRSINIAPSSGLGTMIHEIGHSLGVKHEHQRSMRDNYVIVDPNAIIDDETARYNILYIDDKADTETNYDILSIMHYATGVWTTWSKDNQPYLTAKDSACETYKVEGSACGRTKDGMGQRMGITQLDADQVANHYRSQNGRCKSSFAIDTPTRKDGLPIRIWYARTTLPFNTMHTVDLHFFGCKRPGEFWWGTTGGGQLVFHGDGALRFHKGAGSVKLPPAKVFWSTPIGGTLLCFEQHPEEPEGYGYLTVYGGHKDRLILWRSPRAVYKLMLFDRHFVMQSKLRYGHEAHTSSFASFPSHAPSVIEIIPWNGCINNYQWTTPGGAFLRIESNGNFVFHRGDGAGNEIDRAWQVGSSGSDCLRFNDNGNLAVYHENGVVIWQSHTDGASDAISPFPAVKIMVFDREWSMFDAQGRAIVTYPPSYTMMKLDSWSARHTLGQLR